MSQFCLNEVTDEFLTWKNEGQSVPEDAKDRLIKLAMANPNFYEFLKREWDKFEARNS